MNDDDNQNPSTPVPDAGTPPPNDASSMPQGTDQPMGGGNPADNQTPPATDTPAAPGTDQSAAAAADPINTTDAPQQQPYNQGEQAVSGTTPAPEADDDTLANAQATGTQLGETPENPQPLNIGGDVDKTEENK